MVSGDFNNDHLARRIRITANVLLALASFTVILLALYCQYYVGGGH